MELFSENVQRKISVKSEILRYIEMAKRYERSAYYVL